MGIGARDVILAYAIGRGVSPEVAAREIGDAGAIAAALEDAAHGESGAIEHARGLFVIQGLDDPEGAIPMHLVLYAYELDDLLASQGAEPFVYVGHGAAFAEDRMEMGIVFARTIDDAERAAFEGSIPPPLGIVSAWGPSGVRFGSDESYAAGVKEVVLAERGEELDHEAIADGVRAALEPDGEEWAAYEATLEDWLRRVHVVLPIRAVLKTSEGSSSAWHTRSVGQLPALEASLERAFGRADVASWVRDTWRTFVRP